MSLGNPGTAPKEEMLQPDGTNDEAIAIQKQAFAWWETTRAKRVYRSRNRGLTITQIYKKEILNTLDL